MRRYGMTKRNPNPPWPNEQSMVVIPPGSNATSVGLSGQRVYEMDAENMLGDRNGAGVQSSNQNSNNVTNGTNSNNESVEESERGIRRDPIMGYFSQGQINRTQMIPTNRRQGQMMPPTMGGKCGNMSVSGYLCGQMGKYVKMEFLFGENIHMEKLGRLREVGKDFVAIQENGTNNMIICSLDKIKFINVYEYGFE